MDANYILTISVASFLAVSNPQVARLNDANYFGSWGSNISDQVTFTYAGPAGGYRVQWKNGLSSPQEWLWLDGPFTNPVAGTNTVSIPVPQYDPAFGGSVFRFVYNPYP